MTAAADVPFFHASRAATLRRLEALTVFMDSAIAIPGTKRSFGADAALSLVPGVGSAMGAGISIYLLFEAWRLNVPVSALVRMAGNVVLDAVLGAVPLIGWVFDFLFKANVRNLCILKDHLERSPA